MIAMHKDAAAVLSIKEMDDVTGEFEGYGSTFGGEPDSDGDVIVAGAYAESLAEHKSKGTMPKMFWQHDRDKPIGKWLDAKEDDTGLLMRGKLNLDVERGREAYEHLKHGDIDGLSIGYRIRKYEVDTETGTWFLKALDLYEVSVVSIGANENATITSVKAAKEAHEIMEKLRAGDRLTEREFETLLKGSLGFSNSQAERAARVHLKGSGEPADAAHETRSFLEALRG
ncbi:HK97 family phage prohead protease [Pseudooceanicola sp. C21-150M6]|uniref:HK97 family phage prohead protease n=1 Tax=Pseudooceanicola sp. C21-150M6 TaxID=3434355 RepID=UPI003D7F22B3